LQASPYSFFLELERSRALCGVNNDVNRLLELDPGINSSLYIPTVTDSDPKTEFLLAGELARATGVSTDTLRHYERKGVLPRPLRSANGYRRYAPGAVDRVRLIRRALGVGFTLDELAVILKERDSGGAPCQRVRELTAAKLADLEARLKQMLELKNELESTLRHWDLRLSVTEVGARANLLESLAADGRDSEKSRRMRSLRNPLKKRKKESTR
jgi:DNA-binding transcriptional MerR regulator